MTDKDKRRLFRYKVQGDSQTGTSHVSYLARPYFSYLVPSCYPGYSKYVYVSIPQYIRVSINPRNIPVYQSNTNNIYIY